jgi:N-acetylglucosaminyldiphosphoundecaprenol N-acetyl-beta-D-mannosaminyltransferase
MEATNTTDKEKEEKARSALREIGLEWAYRLWQEPGRMWKRYLVGNFVFAFHAWKEYRKRGIHR